MLATLETQQVIIPSGRFEVDPAHSQIAFRVVDAEALKVIAGRFSELEGAIEDGVATGIVRVASLTTAQQQRDEHLLSADFFEADTYPEFRFSDGRLESLGDDGVKLTGSLELKGIAQQVELEGTLTVGEDRVVFTSTGTLEWGPMTVELIVDVTAAKSA